MNIKPVNSSRKKSDINMPAAIKITRKTSVLKKAAAVITATDKEKTAIITIMDRILK